MGLIFFSGHLFRRNTETQGEKEDLDVLDNVLLPYRVSPALTLDGAARQRAGELVEQVGLADKRNSFPRQLSQGERQRVAVCRSLVTRPKVLFGDEPTANLDTDNRDHVMDTLFRYAKEQRVPLVSGA